MSEAGTSPQSQPQQSQPDRMHEGREDYFMDIDRMVNEGLGGGQITVHNGWIDASTTDTMDEEERSLTEQGLEQEME